MWWVIGGAAWVALSFCIGPPVGRMLARLGAEQTTTAAAPRERLAPVDGFAVVAGGALVALAVLALVALLVVE